MNPPQKVEIERHDEDFEGVLLPGCIARLVDSQEIRLQTGLCSLTTRWREDGPEARVKLPPTLMQQLFLSEGWTCRIYVNENTVRFGPMIGVLINDRVNRWLKNQDPRFREAERAAANRKSRSILYFFSPQDVDFSRQSIHGTYYEEKTGFWEQRAYPFPDVFYDRGGAIPEHQKALARRIRRQFAEDARIRQVNARHHFNKWDLYRKLSQREDMKRYLPLTALYREQADFRKMFRHHPVLYIKDVHGSNGRRIVRVIRHPGTFMSAIM